MKLSSLFMSSRSKKHHYMPLLSQQASYLKHASSALCEMMETMDPVKWRRLEKEVKACEVQGDALLSELHEQLYENILKRSIRSDIQLLSMNIDEFLDNINDSAKSILLYMPQRIDPHMKDLAQYINAEAESIRKMMPYMIDLKKNFSQIAVQCERITELEHAADDTFAEYIGYIFTNESDPIELIKYKNIAETLEAATDAAKMISDTVKKMLMVYLG